MKNLFKKEHGSMWGTWVMYLLIGFVYILLLAKATCPVAQRVFLNQFHLRSQSFIQWASLQFVPWMYNYANEVWLTTEPLQSAEVPTQFVDHQWLNHYPLRYVSFGLFRHVFYSSPENKWLYVRSRYQDKNLVTIYELEISDDELHVIPQGAFESR